MRGAYWCPSCTRKRLVWDFKRDKVTGEGVYSCLNCDSVFKSDYLRRKNVIKQKKVWRKIILSFNKKFICICLAYFC